jgi:endonuclease YncB( thermonuclease family)
MVRSALPLAILLVLVPGCVAGCSPDIDTHSPGSTEIRVSRVIDGDTIEVEGGWRVRYIGIDTPEVYPQLERYGAEAMRENRELVEGKVVRLERDQTDRDRYGRLLRYVYVDDLFVNGELVRLGCARAVAYPPDTKYQDVLARLEKEAREAGRGLWRDPTSRPGPSPEIAVVSADVDPSVWGSGLELGAMKTRQWAGGDYPVRSGLER